MSSVTLGKLIELHQVEMKRTTEIMRNSPWENKEFYAEWCAQFFYFVAHATRLLAASASRLQLDKDPLHLRFLDHCQEEKNHEKLFEKDLLAMGKKPNNYSEHPLACLLYQSQYYMIDYVNPMALFGSILFLEGMSISVGPEIGERIEKIYGKDATNFIRVHVHDDQDHIEKAYKALEQMDSKELSAIYQSYQISGYAFNQLLLELKEKYQALENPYKKAI